MSDQIIRMLAKDAPVKASAITAGALVERARQIHKTLPTATAALGAITENDKAFGKALIFVGLAEGVAQDGLIVALLLLFV